MALQTDNIVGVVADLRSRGLPFLPVPPTYYSELQQRQNYLPPDWPAIAASEVLADWQEDLVKGKQVQAGGFGAGNFRALFEAIEREQIKRGSLIND